MTLPQLLQRALALHQAGKLDQAEPIYLQMLALEPADYPSLHLMGLLRFQQGHMAEAITLMETALKSRPSALDTLVNYALALSALDRQEEALAALTQAAALQPGNSGVFSNRGAIKVRLGKPADALADFERAVALDGRNFDAQLNRALTLHQLSRYDEALRGFDTLLAALPDHIEGRNARGLTLHMLGRNDEALAEFEAVILRAPRHAGAYVNRATILWLCERLDQALESYASALALEPNNLAALESRANLLWTRRQALAPATADLEAVVRIKPDQPYALGDLLQLKMHAGDWFDFKATMVRLDEAVRAGQPAVQPFVYQALSESPSDLLTCATTYAARECPPQPMVVKEKARRAGRIRVGYVCGEFRAQATMYLAAGLFEHHDRTRFEIFAFDNGRDDKSPMRARVTSAFDKFIPIAALSDRDAAARIAAEEADILVNLNGYFGKMRMNVFARRPAPIQVNYLGFPGTLGASYMDYILADTVLIAEGDERWYAEKVVRLPASYQINDDQRAPVVASTRAQHGLPENAFVFCHFNYGYKITPDLFACWMRILGGTENSVLWLLAGDPLFARNLKKEAARQGIDPARLIFAPVLELQAHLARLPLGDLFLDSLISGAHTTASDALWAGLPLITRCGHAFAGRVSASLLTAMDLAELVSASLKDYENLALALARNPGRLKKIRERLVKNRRTAPLFDTALTTRHIEAAYEEMHERRLRGEAPLSFAVAPLS